MCGILAILNSHESAETLRPKIVALAKRLRHRGPDWSGVHFPHTADPSGRAVGSHTSAYFKKV